MIFYTRIFRYEKVFRNKRVAIIGAADSAFDKENGSFIDDFDIIVRVNKAPHSWTLEKAKFIGSRTDVLFHSFYENMRSGGGPIDFNLYRSQGIEFLVNPNNNFKGLRTHLNYFKRNFNNVITYILPRSLYNKMMNNFGDIIPTVGFSALYTVLNSNCKEVFITGFTFFKTPYANDYRDHFKDMKENAKHIRKQGIHDPDLEFEIFKKELNATNCDVVKMDDRLFAIVNSSK